MNLWRILTVFFGLLIAAPTVILNANGYNIAFWVDKDAVSGEVIETVEPDPIIAPRDRPEVQTIFATDRLTDARYIMITEVIAPADLLQPGEAMPEKTLLPLYAAARAPARLIQYCDEVIATIGTTCDVVHTETHENQDGKHELTGHLAFIPAFDMGNPYDMDDGILVEASIDLPFEGDLLPANNAATRQEAMIQAIEICTALRGAFGNCSVAQVSFTINELWITDLEALPAGTNPQRVSVQVAFAVFADETQLNETALLERLRGLTNLT